MKRIRLLSLLLVATLLVQNAAATLLPYSSYYQGRSHFNDDVTGYVDFAVYDTLGPYGNEWTGAGFAAPGAGQYIYAYQIFNDVGSADAIGFFTIKSFDDHHLTGINTMNTQNPWEDYPLTTEGITPTDWNANLEETEAIWKFADATGDILVAGEYSWFLIFSSNTDWVQGKYETGPTGGFPITGNPEPCTLALLGLGGTILFAKRRNSVKSHRARSHN